MHRASLNHADRIQVITEARGHINHYNRSPLFSLPVSLIRTATHSSQLSPYRYSSAHARTITPSTAQHVSTLFVPPLSLSR